MAHQLIWLNSEKQTYHVNWCRLSSKFEIGDINKRGHILVNVLHYSTLLKTPYSGSFKNYYKITSNLYEKAIRYDHKNLIKKVRKGLSVYLIKLGKRLDI